MIFFVDGEQAGIGYLGVLVNGDPRKRQRQEMGTGAPSSEESKPCPSRQAQVPPPGSLSRSLHPIKTSLTQSSSLCLL